MKKLIFTVILLPLLGSALAQDFIDNALLFSRTQPGGSSRIQALGGAQVSLGGDYSSALSNPAGLGMFNRSEVTFSLGLNDNSTSSTYFGNTSEDGRTVLTIPGFSYIQKHQKTKGKYLGGAFAFTFSRTNNFNAQYSYQGDNSQSSIIDYFKTEAEYYDPAEMLYQRFDFYNLTALAYNNYLFEDLYDENDQFIGYGSALDPLNTEVRTVRQQEEVIRKGSQSQISFSYGGNYNDEFFFGASLGASTIRFKQSQNYTESNYRFSEDPDYNPLDYFTPDENFDIQGSGINLTLGAIYRPVEFLQIGASIVTPTFYNITDSYVAGLAGRWNNFDYFGDGDPLNATSEEFDVPVISEYDLTTPAKFTTGVTFINKYGFVTGDIEFINYSKTKYSSNIPGVSFNQDNSLIKSSYKNVVNYRIGAEFRYEIFRLRGGFNFQADPYQLENQINRSIQTLSAGAGVRFTNFFIDFVVAQSKGDTRRTPYNAFDFPVPVATQQNKTTNYNITVGFPF